MKQRGFTIIEVLISILIIGVILILLQSVLRGGYLARNAKNQVVALTIVRNELEGLRAGGYDALPASGSFSDSLLSTLPGGATANITVSDYNDTTKQVSATVTWTDPGYSAASIVSLSTLVTKVGGLP